ncbi:Sec-independent protein translocase subunit TatA [Corynebacterium uropygiale]|uniref:Sec-independent protein translocase protein TatA n=1 Tax=Corynebacterium uropygiale TaxID=1775911 RepID=A0A9X1QNI6_9CORY|nr:Sec-independent protein translocase subunit TatA [Corynebacterium uropygiale]MCF4006657.1 Sec-independent protein translocase subunit TatA [Corynebacterium uropygiale]
MTLGPWEIALIILLVIVLFGAKRLPDAARSLGRSMRIFKSEVKEMGRDDERDEAQRAQQAQQTQQALPPQQPATPQQQGFSAQAQPQQPPQAAPQQQPHDPQQPQQ